MSVPSRVGLALLALAAGAPIARAAAGAMPWRFTAGLIGLAVLSAARPLDGLLVVCGLFPLASMIGVFAGVPWPGTQTALCFTLAFLAGWLFHAAWRGAPVVAPGLGTPSTAYAAVIVASAAVTSITMFFRPDAPFEPGLRELIEKDYLQPASSREPLIFAFHALVALGLLGAASAVPGHGAAMAVIRMTVIGLSAAGILNVARFAQVIIATGEPLAAAESYGRWLRVNVHYGDLNAAGSAFALGLLAAIGAAAASRGVRRIGFVGCGTVLTLALWLAGSRAAIAAVALAAAAALAFRHLVRASSKRTAWLVAASLLLASAIMAAWMLARFPRVQANADPSSALAIRVELLLRAGRMVADAPVFGVGVGRFFVESARYATPRSFGPENSHNILAQIAAELGLVGLAAFVWLLVAVWVSVSRTIGRGPRPDVLWAAAGAVAFLLSGMGGHPLIVFDAALPFWIVLGVLSRHGVAGAAAARTSAGTGRARRGMLVAAALLVVSIPVRAIRIVEWRGLAELSDRRWQWDGSVGLLDARDHHVILAPPQTAALVIPMTLASDGPDYAHVLVTLDGTPANGFPVTTGEWTQARLWLPRLNGYVDRRIELRLTGARADARLLVGRVILEK